MSKTIIQQYYYQMMEAEQFDNKDAKNIISHCINQIKSLVPQNKKDYYLQASFYYNEKDYANAQIILNKMLTFFPSSARAKKLLGYALIHQGLFKEASEVFQELVILTPNDYEVIDDYGNVLNELWHIKKDLSYLVESIRQYDKLIKLNPPYITAFNNKAVSLKELGNYSGAIDTLLQAIYTYNVQHKSFFYNLAQLYVLQNDYKSAMRFFDNAIDLDKNYASALNDRGMLHLTNGQHIEAYLDFKSAVLCADKKLQPIIEVNLQRLREDSKFVTTDFYAAENTRLTSKLKIQKEKIIMPYTCLQLLAAYKNKNIVSVKSWKLLKIKKVSKYYEFSLYENTTGQLVITHHIKDKYLSIFSKLDKTKLLHKLHKITIDARFHMEELKAQHKGKTFIHTGLLYGASIAEICALIFNQRAITFESMGSAALAQKIPIIAKIPSQVNISTYLSNFNLPGTYLTHLGEVHSIDCYDTAEINTVKKNSSLFSRLLHRPTEPKQSIIKLLSAFDKDIGIPKKQLRPENLGFDSHQIINLSRFSPIAQEFLKNYLHDGYRENNYNFDQEVLFGFSLKDRILTYRFPLLPDEFIYYIEDKIISTHGNSHAIEKAKISEYNNDRVDVLLNNNKTQTSGPIYYQLPKPNAIKSSYTSSISPDLKISHDRWTVSLLCKPSGKDPKHAFIVIEGIAKDGKAVYLSYDLVKSKTEGSVATVRLFPKGNIKQSACCNTQDRKQFFQEHILFGQEVCGRSWSISREQARQLHSMVIKDKSNPPRYQKLGNESLISKAVGKQGHNCFTWARQIINSLGEPSIHIEDKAIDFIGTHTNLYLNKPVAQHIDVNTALTRLRY
jgi:tetratricopeptide (TPR) repeat protein